MSHHKFALCLLQAALLASIAQMALGQQTGDCKRGRATYYTVDSIGACGFGDDAGIYTFAPNEAFFNGSARCGECFEVTGPKGTRVMMVSNMCPVSGNERWCSGDYDHFDIDSRAFPDIGEADYGVMYTSIRPVVCPSTGGVSIIIGDYNGYYLQVFFSNHKVPISSVTMTMSNMAKTQISRTTFNAFISPENQAISYPVTYELTSVHGEVITVTIPQAPTANRQKFTSSAQFTQWTVPSPSNTCPSVHDYNVFMNGWNPDVASNHMVAQNWRNFRDTSNDNFIADLPNNASKGIRDSLAQWNEWGFGSVVPIPENTIAAIELQLKSSAALTELRFSWKSGSDYHQYIIPSIPQDTWTHYYLPKSLFPLNSQSVLPPLDILALQPNAATTITIANFRILPVAGVVPPPTGSPPTQSPPATHGTPTQSPPTQGPPSQTPPTQNPPSQNPPSEQSPSSAASQVSLAASIYFLAFLTFFF